MVVYVGSKGKQVVDQVLVSIHISISKVKLRNDMPDDMLKDAIETSRRIISNVVDFETEGNCEQ